MYTEKAKSGGLSSQPVYIYIKYIYIFIKIDFYLYNIKYIYGSQKDQTSHF